MSDMNCEQIKDILYDYAEGETSDIVSSEISTHLKECDGCRTEYEKIRAMLENLKASEVIPDERLYSGVMSKIGKRRKSVLPIVGKYAVAAACVVIAIAVGIAVKYIDPFRNIENDKAAEQADKKGGAAMSHYSEAPDLDPIPKSTIEGEDMREEDTVENGTVAFATDEMTVEEGTCAVPQAMTSKGPDQVINSNNEDGYTEKECVPESAELSTLNFYDMPYSQAESDMDGDTCASDDEDIESYYRVSDLAAQRYGEVYGSIDVYRDAEKELWVVLVFDWDGRAAAKYTYDNNYALMSEEVYN